MAWHVICTPIEMIGCRIFGPCIGRSIDTSAPSHGRILKIIAEAEEAFDGGGSGGKASREWAKGLCTKSMVRSCVRYVYLTTKLSLV